jgi:hypothetical protein
MPAVSIPCGICSAQIQLGMKTCPGCDRPVTEQDAAVLQVRLEGGNFQAHDRGRRVRNGSKWIGFLALLFAVSAPIQYAIDKMEVEKTMVGFDSSSGEDSGEVSRPSTRALISLYEPQLRLVLIVNLLLAALMGGLWFWARRAPLPAIGCALALFLVVQLVGALWDPSTIFKGLLMKAVAVAALWRGLKAALDARAALARLAS